MQTIELEGEINAKGKLILNQVLPYKNRKVKVVILLPQLDDINERLWLKSVSSNPSFDFLHDEAENIYSLEDGKPFQG